MSQTLKRSAKTMPIIQATLVEGHDDAVVANFIKEIAHTASRTLDAILHLAKASASFL